MPFKICEYRASGDFVTDYEAETLEDAVDRVASEMHDNSNYTESYYSHDVRAANTFKIFEVTEVEIPFMVSTEVSDRKPVTASAGKFTITA